MFRYGRNFLELYYSSMSMELSAASAANHVAVLLSNSLLPNLWIGSFLLVASVCRHALPLPTPIIRRRLRSLSVRWLRP